MQKSILKTIQVLDKYKPQPYKKLSVIGYYPKERTMYLLCRNEKGEVEHIRCSEITEVLEINTQEVLMKEEDTEAGRLKKEIQDFKQIILGLEELAKGFE